MTDLARGAYDTLVTQGLEKQLSGIDGELVQRTGLDPTDAHELLARHVAALAKRALRAVPGTDAQRLAGQVELANRIAAAIRDASDRVLDADDNVAAAQRLTAILHRPTPPAPITPLPRPEIPLSTGALLVNGRNQPRIGHEVAKEMASADQVDLLCAFIKWHGLRTLERPITQLLARGCRMRVITTTYLGATDQRALDQLARWGAKIKVSYETKTTRLHAKAWLFRRATGATTAYVGSSNLSRTALLDGVEWNVRLSAIEQPDVVDTFEATFEDYWEDPAFEDYDPEVSRERLRVALSAERGGGGLDDTAIELTTLDVRPYPYQQEILDDLDAERKVHGRHRNLVVMATGTGKTVVAALDYRRLRRDGKVGTLLFVAHQEQILRQSRSVFRQVLRDGSFGETLVSGEKPREWRHVFASVQSLNRLDLSDLDPAHFDMVIVDEFHHAEAPTYARLLRHLTPRVLLGLTATPDRADGRDVRQWFDGHTAVELHLWEALERQLLAPFQYFGLHDDVDVSRVRWTRGRGYDQAELSNLYTGNDARARIILQQLRDKVDVRRMRALVFCVDIAHAEFMADRFRREGIAAQAVTSRPGGVDRRAAVEALAAGRVQALCTVDLFNEGVDLPTVDTILLLRPTESATIFLQQLGRGLRLADDKPCLTVLDFIGAQHAEFRFDLRFRALTGTSRRALAHAVADDFPTLPSGCHIELDRVAKDVVLANLQSALTTRTRDLVAELRRLGADVTLGEFLAETGLEIEDVYRRRNVGGWSGLRRRAGFDASDGGADDAAIGAAIGRMLHVDDPDRLEQLQHVARGERPEDPRLLAMLHHALWGGSTPIDVESSLARLWAHLARCSELSQVADVLRARIPRVTWPLPSPTVPLRVHARYSRDEACAAFGVPNPAALREGVKWVESERADLFFVTLVKTEAHYSATTMYQDRAITPELFQWESQSTTASTSPTGQRYINHAARGSTVHLFVRETKMADGDLGAPPYLYAGPMTYVKHSGDRPMRIVWRLENPLPADVFHAARVAAA
ncbi:Superfamily II DNA or RNA helicase [Micromonospora pattaloongensis]|uniref:Superfamily II DNA or RNA helicase n=1 Tax=Micromonospora pattaloongensis TaxID=405436 RepID=A0A1H3LYV9_9ACTN|nr:DUF3427 domain-containing protein [Micromonospora pattaloongensis]SDY69209.1 Superfamily II DNA or RNA helicase [Micromonospora pattaloongensis]